MLRAAEHWSNIVGGLGIEGEIGYGRLLEKCEMLCLNNEWGTLLKERST